MLGFLYFPGVNLVLAWSLEPWASVSVDFVLSTGMGHSGQRCRRRLLWLLWDIKLVVGQCLDGLLGLIFLGLLYVKDDVDKGLVVILVGDSQESIRCDAWGRLTINLQERVGISPTQIGKLLRQILSFIRIVQDPSFTADSNLFVAVTELKSQEILDQVIQCCPGHVNVGAGLEDTADRAIGIWWLWPIRSDEPSGHARREGCKEGLGE